MYTHTLTRIHTHTRTHIHTHTHTNTHTQRRMTLTMASRQLEGSPIGMTNPFLSKAKNGLFSYENKPDLKFRYFDQERGRSKARSVPTRSFSTKLPIFPFFLHSFIPSFFSFSIIKPSFRWN